MNENDEGFINPRRHNDPKATVNIEGKWYAPEEVEQVERQNAARRAESARKTRDAWEASPQGKLCLALYEAFQTYRAYLEKHPHARKTIWGYEVDFDEHKLFAHGLRAVDEHRLERAEKLRKNLEKAGGGGSIPSLATIFSATYRDEKPEFGSNWFQKHFQQVGVLSLFCLILMNEYAFRIHNRIAH